jgi:hypothetical protein
MKVLLFIVVAAGLSCCRSEKNTQSYGRFVRVETIASVHDRDKTEISVSYIENGQKAVMLVTDQEPLELAGVWEMDDKSVIYVGGRLRPIVINHSDLRFMLRNKNDRRLRIDADSLIDPSGPLRGELLDRVGEVGMGGFDDKTK